VDEGFAIKDYDEDKIKAVHYFKEHHNKETVDACLDMDERFLISDQEAMKIIHALFKIKKSSKMNTTFQSDRSPD